MNELTQDITTEITRLNENLEKANAHPFKVLEKVMLRTVTHITVGRVVGIKGKFLIVGEAAWIADTGRWAEFLAKGTVSECEIYPQGSVMGVNMDSIVDYAPWGNDLITETK